MLPSLDRLTIDGHGALLPATTPDPEQERAAHYAFWLLKRDGFSRELINGSGVNSYVCEFAVSVDGARVRAVVFGIATLRLDHDSRNLIPSAPYIPLIRVELPNWNTPRGAMTLRAVKQE